MQTLRAGFDRAMDMTEEEARTLESEDLERRAKALDIPLPASDDSNSWIRPTLFKATGKSILSRSAREEVRQKIDVIEKRQFEARARWVTLLTPAIAAPTGLIGAITGLIALVYKIPKSLVSFCVPVVGGVHG